MHNPKNWAYIISISSLAYFFYRLYYSFYPYSRLDRVYKFYQEQIENNEVPFLLDIIEKYHKSDIIKYLTKTKDVEPNPSIASYFQFNQEKSFKEKVQNRLIIFHNFLVPSSWNNRKSYAKMVLFSILNDAALIPLAANHRPYLFADLICNFKKSKRGSFPNDLINSFLSELINHKNFWLIKELKQSENFDSGQPGHFFIDNRILSALLKDLSVADANEVWQPFGNIGYDEITEEREKGYSSCKQSEQSVLSRG